MKTLNIVNGDTSINIMKKAGIEGDFLPWLDFLHEGPVPQNLSSVDLAKVRTSFIAEHIQGEISEIDNEFKKRNKVLDNYQSYNKIVLWFEHDLYDQLQLLEVLSWLSQVDLKDIEVSIVTSNTYISQLKIQKVSEIYNNKLYVTKLHLELANQAWQAFREPNPLKWAELLQRPSDAVLPFLKVSVLRMLEEFPDVITGLSRTQSQTLTIISKGIHDAEDIFQKSQDLEKRPFMGEVIFWKLLHDFEKAEVIKRENKKLLISKLGREILSNKKSWLGINGIDRHIGGTHLHADNLWCWDKNKKKIQKYYYSKTLNSSLPIK